LELDSRLEFFAKTEFPRRHTHQETKGDAEDWPACAFRKLYIRRFVLGARTDKKNAQWRLRSVLPLVSATPPAVGFSTTRLGLVVALIASCVRSFGDGRYACRTQPKPEQLRADLSKLLWTQRAKFGPSPRYTSAIAYDSTRRRTVLFGGLSPAGRLSDTWEWDGSFWTQMHHTGPAPRAGGAIAYDEANQVSTLFGGNGTNERPLGDTWKWDGTDWTKLSESGPSRPPRPRRGIRPQPQTPCPVRRADRTG
jgi:hypothetical protein